MCKPAEAKSAEALKPDTVFIGGPCGGSAVMLKSIAEQARGKSLNKNVSCYISPLTQDDLSEGIRKKSIATLVDFGCELLPSGITLSDFMRLGNINGTILSVPDHCPEGLDDCRVIYASGETAIEAAASGKI
jgi:homoaconitase/3-isopropylmalate dehydratase large subunit